MSAPKNISIQQIISILLRRIKFILIITVIGGIVFFGYSKFLITPTYTTSAMISVQNFGSGASNEENQKIYGSDISGSTSLAGICVTLFQNSDKLTTLYDGCTVTIEATDFFITFTVSGDDPQKCVNVANQLTEAADEVYKSHFSYGKVSLIREAKLPSGPISPNNMKNALMGIVVGLALSCVISVLLELIDTTIKVDDDIQDLYGIPVFAEIPDFESQA